MTGWLSRRRCVRKGHDWFPAMPASEFLPVDQSCLRCRESRTLLPWGKCLGGHAIAHHYDEHGQLVQLHTCPGPR